MEKLIMSDKKDTREQLKIIVKYHPKQTEEEILTDRDAEGFNHNPSEQQNYPGVQKHSFFELLKKDHVKVKVIIEDLLTETSKSSNKYQALLLSLKSELQQHEEIERSFVYPILESKKLTHDLTQNAYQEHCLIDVLLSELESFEFKDETWRTKLKELQKSLLQHIKAEEEDLFIKAEKALTKDELSEIYANIAEAKSCS